MWLLNPVCGITQDNQFSRKSLRDISGMSVLVEPTEDQEKRDGLSEQDIQTDVELKLRLAGIQVFPKGRSTSPGIPYLYISVNTILQDGVLYAFHTEVALYQEVLLQRDQSIGLVDAKAGHPTTAPLSAATWSTGRIGAVSKGKLSQVRSLIKDSIDVFLNAYLSVNPRR